MAWSGTGIFNRLYNWVNDRDANIPITASRMDAEMDDMATGIQTCVAKDGQNSPTANLPMATYKHTNVGSATARTEYASAGQVQDGGLTYAVDTGAADAYAVSISPAPTAYATGMTLTFKATNTNTGASTINVNSIGAKTIKRFGALDLGAGDIESGGVYSITYDGTNFQLNSPVSNFFESLEWRDWGHTVTYASSTTFTVPGDQTAIYVANRPIKCNDASTLYGKVSSSSYSSNTTVTVTLDSGSLSASLSSVELGIDPTGYPIPLSAVRGSASADWLSNTSDATQGDALVGMKPTWASYASTVHTYNENRFYNAISDFGAIGDGSSNPLSTRYGSLAAAQAVYPHVTALTEEIDWAAIQGMMNALSTNGGGIGFVPPGEYVFGANGLELQSHCILAGAGKTGTVITFTRNSECVYAKNNTSARSYNICARDLKIDCTSTATYSSSVGLSLKSVTDGLVENVQVTNAAEGFRTGSYAGGGGYYNTFLHCVASTCTVGYNNGLLGNEIRWVACRAVDVTDGWNIADASHSHIISPAVETFTGNAFSITGTSNDAHILFPRIENSSTAGTGVNIASGVLRTTIDSPYLLNMSTDINNAGTATRINGRIRVSATIDFPSISAGSSSDQLITATFVGSNDTVSLTPPASLDAGLIGMAIPSPGAGVYVRLANVTSSAIDPASMTYVVDVIPSY